MLCLHVSREVGVCLHVPARVEMVGHVSSFVGLYLGLSACLLRLEGQACISMSLCAWRAARMSALVCAFRESGRYQYVFARMVG